MKRLRQRYLVIRRVPDAESLIRSLQGEFEGLRRIEARGTDGFILLRCTHRQLPAVRERLGALGLEVVGVSGTIKSAVRKFIRKD
jgi:hypothetical protein